MQKHFVFLAGSALAFVTVVIGLRSTGPTASTEPVAMLAEPPTQNRDPERNVRSTFWKSSSRGRDRLQTTPAPQQTLFTGQSIEAQLGAAQEIAAQGSEEAVETLANFIAKAAESPDPIQQQLGHDVAALMRQMTSDTALPMMTKLAYHSSELVSEAAVDAAVGRDPIAFELQQGTIDPTLQIELDNAAQGFLQEMIWGQPILESVTPESGIAK